MFMARIRGLIVVAAIVFVVIPVLRGSIAFLGNVPAWIYYTCCGSGVLAFAVYFVIEYKDIGERNDRAETERLDNAAALASFDDRLRRDPVETKKAYLRFRVAAKKWHRHLDGYLRNVSNASSPEFESASREAKELSAALFGRFITNARLMDLLDRQVSKFEQQQEAAALQEFDSKMDLDADTTMTQFEGLLEALALDKPDLGIELSEKLFGPEQLLVSRATIWSVGHSSSKLKEVRNTKTTARALEVYRRKEKEAPGEVAKNLKELTETIDYILHAKLDYSGQKTPAFERAFSLSEQLFGERVDIGLLGEIASGISRRGASD